ncbi:DUF6895 family protein [Enterococcus faecium]
METNLLNCIKYLTNNINLFNVATNSFTNEEIKPFIELVFCYNLLPDSHLHNEEYRKINRYIRGVIQTGDFENKFIHNLNAISGICILEEFLLKNDESLFKGLLVDYIENKKIDLQLKRTPFRLMDMKYSINKAGVKDNLPSIFKIFEETILGKQLSPYYLTPMSIYSVTHTIFYMTDMGRKSKYNHILLQNKEYFKILIYDSIIRNDLDILAELILCCYFLKLNLNEDFASLIKLSIDFIKDSQDYDGSFPAPLDHNYFSKIKRFKERYHTTLVCMGALTWFEVN